MDHSANSASLFHKHAELYRDKFMDLTMYYDSYREFCDLLPQGRARVLDAACGPGNVSRYLLAQRPDLDLLGIDQASHSQSEHRIRKDHRPDCHCKEVS